MPRKKTVKVRLRRADARNVHIPLEGINENVYSGSNGPKLDLISLIEDKTPIGNDPLRTTKCECRSPAPIKVPRRQFIQRREETVFTSIFVRPAAGVLGQGSASLALAATSLFLLTSMADVVSAQEYSLCAYRSGTSGPCTCRGPNDTAGQFSEVPDRYCRSVSQPATSNKPVVVPQLPERATADEEEAAEIDTVAARQEPAPSPSADATATTPTSATLAEARERGSIRCGVNTGLQGFSARGASGLWEGVDADFCRAVAIAALGDADKVEFVPLNTKERFEALNEGKVDLLSRNTTWTMSRVVDLGVEFVGVAYFDGQGFLTRVDRGLVSAQQLDGLTICVLSGTTTEANLDYYLDSHNLMANRRLYADKDKLIRAYTSGECDAYTADRSALYSDRAGFDDPQAHEVLPETISKEPLGPVVRQGDRNWAEIVRWTLAALVNAEEVGLTKELASGDNDLKGDALRLVEAAGKTGKKLGLEESWIRDVIGGVGNYGELFENNLGGQTPLGMERGMNALWKRGGLLYAPPMW